MSRRTTLGLWLVLTCGATSVDAAPFPAPTLDVPLARSHGEASLVVAGGCFWGVQAVFQHVRGVTSAVSGYAGGASYTAHYSVVSLGITGHAESVRITYDPARVTLGQLLRVFFSVAHDPTQRNRQGPDEGQQRVASAYIEQLDAAGVFEERIATEVRPLEAFFVAESYHQDYAMRHPDAPYIVRNDAPKVAALRTTFPDLYVER